MVTCCSCITSSSAAWVLAGARLISSASSRLVNTGPRRMLKRLGLRVVDRVAGDVAGHQVGRELDAREAAVERLRQRAHQQRLAQAGHAFDQHVAAGEQRDQDLVEHLGLADEGLGDLVAHGGGALRQRFAGDRDPVMRSDGARSAAWRRCSS